MGDQLDCFPIRKADRREIIYLPGLLIVVFYRTQHVYLSLNLN